MVLLKLGQQLVAKTQIFQHFLFIVGWRSRFSFRAVAAFALCGLDARRIVIFGRSLDAARVELIVEYWWRSPTAGRCSRCSLKSTSGFLCNSGSAGLCGFRRSTTPSRLWRVHRRTSLVLCSGESPKWSHFRNKAEFEAQSYLEWCGPARPPRTRLNPVPPRPLFGWANGALVNGTDWWAKFLTRSDIDFWLRGQWAFCILLRIVVTTEGGVSGFVCVRGKSNSFGCWRRRGKGRRIRFTIGRMTQTPTARVRRALHLTQRRRDERSYLLQNAGVNHRLCHILLLLLEPGSIFFAWIRLA